MSDQRNLQISFDVSSAGDAAQLASLLQQDLNEAAAVDVTQLNTRPGAQDLGATLVVLFGTPVAIVLAKAVANFLQRHSGASISITENGAVIAKNLDSKDAARIAEAFAGRL